MGRQLGTYSLNNRAVIAKVMAGGIKIYSNPFYLGSEINWEQVTPLQDVDALYMLQHISPQLKKLVASKL